MAVLTEDALTVAVRRYFLNEEEGWENNCRRVAKFAASAEVPEKIAYWEEKFAEMIFDMKFLPGGRILRNAGKLKGNTFNCFVLGVEDDIVSIGDLLKHCLIVWADGAGVGVDFSPLRPVGASLKTKGGESSGLVSFVTAVDHIAKTIETGGSRRSAALAMVKVNHPEVEGFINAKLKDGVLSNFNISVAVNEEFLTAVEKGNGTKWDLEFGGRVYKTVDAKELWQKIMFNMLEHAEPGLINESNLVKNNSYFFDPISCVNPCSELPLGVWAACLLGSLVLPSFVKQKNTDLTGLAETIETAVRFLDNIIDVNYYSIQQVENKVKLGRRQGLGTMGLADYLFKKELRYGSPKALSEIERLYKFIRDKAYESSVKLAIEKGAFPRFDKVMYGKASFIRKLPASLRKSIKDHGSRAVTILTQPPTGCLVGNTLIPSNKGLLQIKDFNSINTTHPIKITSDFGISHFKKFYNQGEAETFTIETKKGYSLQGTADHRVRILSDGNGYLWKKLEDLEKGDWVVMKKNFIIDRKTWVRKEVAELLGFYMADGWWTVSGRGRRLYFSIHKKEVNYVLDLIEKSFGSTFVLNPIVRDLGDKSARIEVNSKKLFDWFDRYECVKKGAVNIFIPDIILSSSKEVIGGFIKGFLYGDGQFNKKYNVFRFNTISKVFVKQLQTVLLGLGFPSRLREEPINDSFMAIKGREIKQNFPCFRLELSNHYSKELSNFIDSKFTIHDVSPSFEIVPLFPDEINKLKSVRINKNKTFTTKSNYLNNEVDSNWFILNDLFIDIIDNVCKLKVERIYDIEIYEKTHTYVANGFITHNTTSLVAGVTSGIEPLFCKAYKRKDNIGERVYIHPLFKEFENSEIPEWFVDTFDLDPVDHFEIQSVIQRFTDGAISKTVNLPKETTVETLNDLLLEYIWDLKGVTVYRDGSREGQPLEPLEKDEIKEYMNKGSNSLMEEDVECASGTCDI